MIAVKVILNPSSGCGLAGGAGEYIARAFDQAGVAFDLSLTEGSGHAIELA